MNKPIVALFSLLFIASAMSFPFSDPSILDDNTENVYLVNKSPSSASSKDVKECDKKCLGEPKCMQSCLKSGKRDDYDSPTATQSTKRTENVPFKTKITQRLVDGIEDELDGDIEKSSSNYVENLVQKEPEGSSSKKKSSSSKKKSSSSSSASSEKVETRDKGGFSQGVSQRTPSTSGGYRTTTTKKLVDDDEDIFDGDILGNKEEDLIQKTSPPPNKVTPPPPTEQKGVDIYALCPKCKDLQCFKQCIKNLNDFNLTNGFVNTASQAAPVAKNKQTTTGTFKGASNSRNLVDDDIDADFDIDDEDD